MRVSYYINGIDFTAYGARVSGSKGLIDALKMKDPERITWPDHHGEAVDLAAPRYESREIALECWIKAANSTAFITAVQSFIAAFQKAGLQRLMVDVNDDSPSRKPLVYQVYLQDEIPVSKRWNPGTMTGTFTLKLREPEPVKRVYSFTAVTGTMTVTMAVTTDEPVNIYWGDGDEDLNADTSSGTISHTYSATGTYYIIISGVIEDITSVTTTATLVWSRL